MLKLLVIADDLSGATDVGVQFAKRGIQGIVYRPFPMKEHGNAQSLTELLRTCEVVSADIQSRHLNAEIAAQRVSEMVRQGQAAGVRLYFKKTDSTLRGNIGAELGALMESSGAKTLSFIPAHPLLGRTTHEGVHYVHGKKLEQSNFANDPRYAMKESRISAIIQKQTWLPTTIISRKHFKDFLIRPPEGITIFDVETLEDLRNAATAIYDAGHLNVIGGSAAFASCLPDFFPFQASVRPVERLKTPFLVINGSLNETSLGQCRETIQNGFQYVNLRADDLLLRDVKSISAQVASLLDEGLNVVMSSVLSRGEISAFTERATKLGFYPAALSEAIANGIGWLMSEILLQYQASRHASKLTMVVFGGDTLGGIMEANNWNVLIPMREPIPGVAQCEIENERNIIIAVKPGGFGNKTLLLELLADAERA